MTSSRVTLTQHVSKLINFVILINLSFKERVILKQVKIKKDKLRFLNFKNFWFIYFNYVTNKIVVFLNLLFESVVVTGCTHA